MRIHNGDAPASQMRGERLVALVVITKSACTEERRAGEQHRTVHIITAAPLFNTGSNVPKRSRTVTQHGETTWIKVAKRALN